jgi:phosphatidate cytidylyltransferase
MIFRVVLIFISAFLIGGVGLYAASRKEEQAVWRARLTKFISYFCIVGLFLLGAFAGHGILTRMMMAVVILGAKELYRVLPLASGGRLSLALGMGAIYTLIAAVAVLFTWLSQPPVAVFVYLIVCAFDGFSQVTGQICGSHPLAPRVSPGKTIEGSAGGLLFAVGMALLLRFMMGWSVLRCVLSCCLIAMAALAGDLLASLVKRRSNVKDFGNLLPGHGGILDRFDSFLFAAAIYLIVTEAARRCTLVFP